jgi:hypothetical protein
LQTAEKQYWMLLKKQFFQLPLNLRTLSRAALVHADVAPRMARHDEQDAVEISSKNLSHSL